jgi:hypothetical protein
MMVVIMLLLLLLLLLLPLALALLLLLLQVDGKRHGRYDIAVRSILGKFAALG